MRFVETHINRENLTEFKDFTMLAKVQTEEDQGHTGCKIKVTLGGGQCWFNN